MPAITEYSVVDLPYDDGADWGAQLTRLGLESSIAGSEWHFLVALPMNASRAKALFSRVRQVTDAEVAAILNSPAAAGG